jgi:DNA mismatch repair protein MutS
MEKTMHRIKNFNVSVKELENKVIFMRKLVPGGSEHSFGIHVAKMAGMPRKVLEVANQLLAQLEGQREGKSPTEKIVKKSKTEITAALSPSTSAQDSGMQLSFFQLNDPVLENIKEELERTDINTLTPVEALMKLNEIKKMIGG